jgi:hypothetical protein
MYASQKEGMRRILIHTSNKITGGKHYAHTGVKLGVLDSCCRMPGKKGFVKRFRLHAVPKLVVSDCSLELLMSLIDVHSSLCLSHEVYYPARLPIVTRGISFTCPSSGVVIAHPIDGTQPRTRTRSMRTCPNFPKSIFQRCATRY